MRNLFLVSFLLCLVFSYGLGEISSQNPLRVAVIGSGISGSSFSYFLKNTLQSEVSLTVFEKEDEVGGRTKTMVVDGIMFHLGASVYFGENWNIANFTSLFHLTPVPVKDKGVISRYKFFLTK